LSIERRNRCRPGEFPAFEALRDTPVPSGCAAVSMSPSIARSDRRRNWLFCWTAAGAKYVGIVKSLIATCRLHDIDPNTYLVDVLQRVGQHPAARLAELTHRQWKT
jgi:hypothetical protein